MSQETFGTEGSQFFNEKPADDLSRTIKSEAVLLGKAGADDPKAEMREESVLLQLKRQQELRKLTAEADKMVQDNQGRRAFSRNIFTVTIVWLAFVMLVVVQCARKLWELSDAVLIALITTTTATVIGIFLIVANYLFNREKST